VFRLWLREGPVLRQSFRVGQPVGRKEIERFVAEGNRSPYQEKDQYQRGEDMERLSLAATKQAQKIWAKRYPIPAMLLMIGTM
jgi:hypothetical protein